MGASARFWPVKRHDADGEPIRGECTVNEA